MRVAAVLAALGLLACSPAPEDAPASAAPAIDGEYVVTFVNEETPLIGIEGYEPTITFSGNRIHFQSQCIYDDWSFDRAGEGIETGEWDYAEPPAMCARSYAPGEKAIIAAVDEATTIRQVRGGLWLSGPGGTVQLERIPDPAQVAARAVDLRGSWDLVSLDGKSLAEPIPLEANFDQVWWEPGCAGQSVNYMIDGARFDLMDHKSPEMVCDIGFPAELPALWQAMDMAETVRADGNDRAILSGKGHEVVLQRR